jgi:hypothetical protein
VGFGNTRCVFGRNLSVAKQRLHKPRQINVDFLKKDDII